MAPIDPAAQDVPSHDELDDILNGTHNGEDIFDTSNIQPQVQHPQPPKLSTEASAELGIDEEIKVERKRQPVPKLDLERLISDRGIPRLQKISKERLKFKGKGHEYADIARMLNMYQLWLDDLYPRAKFADALTIIEQLGHKSNVQVHRNQWLDKNKPGYSTPVDNEDVDVVEDDQVEAVDAMEVTAVPDTMHNHEAVDKIPDAELNKSNEGEAAPEYADPDEDELDALLAESEALDAPVRATVALNPKASTTDDLFADEMEIMAEMEDMW